ncbi:MAG TPA: hypothetical protein VK907_14145 [Phnomibacter sp.]|nr:hypothetical protein [Phnomibacter sp.]
MLEQLLSMVREIGQEQVVNNSLIPNEKNETVMATASETILSSFQQAIAGGRGDELLSMFKSNSSAEIMSNPLALDIQEGFAANAQEKLGLSSNVVKGLAATMIPIIISKLVKRTNSTAQEDSGFSLEGLLGDLTGSAQRTSGGGLDIGSLIGQFTGGGQQQGGGGIGGMLQQLIGGDGGRPQAGQQDMIGNLIKGFFGK